MSEWSQKVTSEFRRTLDRKNNEKAAFVEQQKIKALQAGQLWNNLLMVFESKCVEVNTDMRRELLSSERRADTNFSVRRNEPQSKTILVKRNPDTYEVAISIAGQAPGDFMTLNVKVNTDEGTAYFADANNAPREASGIAEAVIEKLLNL